MQPVGIKLLPSVTLATTQLVGSPKADELAGMAVIALGATQILGGGVLIPLETKGKVDVRRGWAVVDLDGQHWAKLHPDVDLYVVLPQIADCARDTISRWASSARIEVQREVDRRAGTESAIRVIIQELHGASLALRSQQRPGG